MLDELVGKNRKEISTILVRMISEHDFSRNSIDYYNNIVRDYFLENKRIFFPYITPIEYNNKKIIVMESKSSSSREHFRIAEDITKKRIKDESKIYNPMIFLPDARKKPLLIHDNENKEYYTSERAQYFIEKPDKFSNTEIEYLLCFREYNATNETDLEHLIKMIDPLNIVLKHVENLEYNCNAAQKNILKKMFRHVKCYEILIPSIFQPTNEQDSVLALKQNLVEKHYQLTLAFALHTIFEKSQKL